MQPNAEMISQVVGQCIESFIARANRMIRLNGSA